MEPVPVLGRDAGGDGVVGVLGWKGLAKSDGDEQTSGSTFGINGGVNGTGLYPVFAEWGDVLGIVRTCLTCVGLEITSSHHART